MRRTKIELLLVEDNQADVDLIQEALKESRVSVTLHVVDRGEKALAYLNREGAYCDAPRPDLVLLDLNLPGIDGREVLALMKASEEFKWIPVVVLTSSEADIDILRTYSLGANAYIVKPVGFPEFLKAVLTLKEFWFELVKLPRKGFSGPYPWSRVLDHSFLSKVKLQDIRTLVVGKSEKSWNWISRILSDSSHSTFKAERAFRISEAVERLKEKRIDLALFELSAACGEGLDAIQKIQLDYPTLPVVVLISAQDSAAEVRAVKDGTQEYVVVDQMEAPLVLRILQYAFEKKRCCVIQSQLSFAENEAKRRAERALSNRDEFISIASHELRTPLTSLKLQVQLFQRLYKERIQPQMGRSEFQNHAPQMDVLLQRLDTDILRFTKLVDTLVDVSKIQSGRLALEKSEFGLLEMSRDVISQFRSQLDEASCVVQVKAEKEVIGRWDRFRVEQVLVNLLSNATKYARGCRVDIGISGDETQATLAVTDYGPGIQSEDQERIFGQYERAVQREDISGFGLGLYIVRQIVDAHGGTVSVKSQVGKGSTFTVKLPRWN